MPPAHLLENRLIFITGASRSGTTLLSFVLRNNRQIFGLKELHYFGEIWDPRVDTTILSEQQLISAAAQIYRHQEHGILKNTSSNTHLTRAQNLVMALPPDQRTPAIIFAAAVNDLTTDSGKQIPCEQTPRNIFYAECLLNIFPNAHFVHIIRDPRAVMASQKRRWKRRSLASDKEGFSRYQSLRVWINYHPYTVARMWVKATRMALSLQEHPRFNLISFEDLIRDPEASIRRLCQQLNIDFEPNMMDVSRVNSSHESSVGGAKKGLHTDAIGQWRESLSSAEASATERICGDQMSLVGYEQSVSASAGAFSELPVRLSYIFHLLGVLAVNPRRAWIQARALAGLESPLKRSDSPNEVRRANTGHSAESTLR